MPVYTVHAPLNGRDAPDRFAFVRDGFHFWAAIAAPLWLAFHRLWLALIGYVVMMLLVGVSFRLLGAHTNVNLVVELLIALLMGFEAASLQRWTLSRGKWRQVGIVIADDQEAAERRFFDRWVEGNTSVNQSPATERESPTPPRPFPQGLTSQGLGAQVLGSHGDILGLFPQPEKPR